MEILFAMVLYNMNNMKNDKAKSGAGNYNGEPLNVFKKCIF